MLAKLLLKLNEGNVRTFFWMDADHKRPEPTTTLACSIFARGTCTGKVTLSLLAVEKYFEELMEGQLGVKFYQVRPAPLKFTNGNEPGNGKVAGIRQTEKEKKKKKEKTEPGADQPQHTFY